MENLVAVERNKSYLLKEYIKLMRPKQYIKNLFVMAALVFSGKILDGDSVIKSIGAFIAFCLISSSVYVLNDIVDIEKDRLHPKKKNRPLASGAISKGSAYILFATLVILSITLAMNINKKLVIIVGLYIINNIIYSFKVKNIVLLDVFSIAIGFILRVCAGSVSIGVEVSSWIILCTFFLSLYLGLGKRKKEISTLKDTASNHRSILKDYNDEIINQMMNIVLSSTIVCYALYSASDKSNSLMIYTTVFVVYGVLRYNYIINVGEEGNPTDVVLKDKALQIDVIIWIISCIIFILI